MYLIFNLGPQIFCWCLVSVPYEIPGVIFCLWEKIWIVGCVFFVVLFHSLFCSIGTYLLLLKIIIWIEPKYVRGNLLKSVDIVKKLRARLVGW